MKRIGRWLLILAATTCLTCNNNVNALKATSIIFGKVPNSLTTTTTTTTAPGTNSTVDQLITDKNESNTDDDDVDEDEATKVPLTGIPQIDYVFDPNLPRELNGYNLSTYPFLSLVPDAEEIDFKCDGLHDGFYASIKYSCQLYHHCIYGVRHDFLCANFTAFDQKTFICQFASVVDCKGSAKYWFRNDALYRATTTTTTTTTTVAPPPTQPTERPYRRRPIRPLRRRRPQVEYYYDDEEGLDDYYYDDEPIGRRKLPPMRTRNRRPVHDADDYDEPLPPRGGYSYDDEDDYQPAAKRRPYDQQSRNRNRNTDKRRYKDDNRDDRRYYDQNKRHMADVDDRRAVPANDESSDRRRYRNRRPADDSTAPIRPRDRDNIRPIPRDDLDDEPPAYSQRESAAAKIRPTGSGSSIFKAPRPPPRINRPVPVNEKKKFEYIQPDKVADEDADYEVSFVKYKQPENIEKPVGRRDQSSVHNSKAATTTTTTTTRDDVYDDDDVVDEEPPVVSNRNFKPARRNPPEPIDDIKPLRKVQSSRYQAPIRTREEDIEEIAEYEDEETTPAYKKPNKYNSRSVVRKSPFLARTRQSEEYVEPSAVGQTAPGSRYANDDYDTIRNQRDSPKGYTSRNPPIIMQRLADRELQRQQAAMEREAPAESRKNVEKNRKPVEVKMVKEDSLESREISSTVRSVKRPFLPSRGGSPYLPRGLKPVGVAQNISVEPLPADHTEPTDVITEVVTSEATVPINSSPPSPPATSTQKPKVPIINNSNSNKEKSVTMSKELTSIDGDDYSEENHESPRQTLEKIYNSEYDIALNDALNPTLKPLTLSSVSPIGFSLSNRYDRTRDYPYDSISRSSSSQLYTEFLQQPAKFPAKSVPNQSQQSQLPYYDDYEY